MIALRMTPYMLMELAGGFKNPMLPPPNEFVEFAVAVSMSALFFGSMFIRH